MADKELEDKVKAIQKMLEEQQKRKNVSQTAREGFIRNAAARVDATSASHPENKPQASQTTLAETSPSSAEQTISAEQTTPPPAQPKKRGRPPKNKDADSSSTTSTPKKKETAKAKKPTTSVVLDMTPPPETPRPSGNGQSFPDAVDMTPPPDAERPAGNGEPFPPVVENGDSAEQARLAAEQARQEAEAAAERERQVAENARLEAAKAQREAEQARLAAQQAIQELEAERARLAAEAEQARREAEQARLAAETARRETEERARLEVPERTDSVDEPSSTDEIIEPSDAQGELGDNNDVGDDDSETDDNGSDNGDNGSDEIDEVEEQLQPTPEYYRFLTDQAFPNLFRGKIDATTTEEQRAALVEEMFENYPYVSREYAQALFAASQNFDQTNAYVAANQAEYEAFCTAMGYDFNTNDNPYNVINQTEFYVLQTVILPEIEPLIAANPAEYEQFKADFKRTVATESGVDVAKKLTEYDFVRQYYIKKTQKEPVVEFGTQLDSVKAGRKTTATTLHETIYQHGETPLSGVRQDILFDEKTTPTMKGKHQELSLLSADNSNLLMAVTQRVMGEDGTITRTPVANIVRSETNALVLSLSREYWEKFKEQNSSVDLGNPEFDENGFCQYPLSRVRFAKDGSIDSAEIVGLGPEISVQFSALGIQIRDKDNVIGGMRTEEPLDIAITDRGLAECLGNETGCEFERDSRQRPVEPIYSSLLISQTKLLREKVNTTKEIPETVEINEKKQKVVRDEKTSTTTTYFPIVQKDGTIGYDPKYSRVEKVLPDGTTIISEGYIKPDGSYGTLDFKKNADGKVFLYTQVGNNTPGYRDIRTTSFQVDTNANPSNAILALGLDRNEVGYLPVDMLQNRELVDYLVGGSESLLHSEVGNSAGNIRDKTGNEENGSSAGAGTSESTLQRVTLPSDHAGLYSETDVIVEHINGEHSNKELNSSNIRTLIQSEVQPEERTHDPYQPLRDRQPDRVRQDPLPPQPPQPPQPPLPPLDPPGNPDPDPEPSEPKEHWWTKFWEGFVRPLLLPIGIVMSIVGFLSPIIMLVGMSILTLGVVDHLNPGLLSLRNLTERQAKKADHTKEYREKINTKKKTLDGQLRAAYAQREAIENDPTLTRGQKDRKLKQLNSQISKLEKDYKIAAKQVQVAENSDKIVQTRQMIASNEAKIAQIRKAQSRNAGSYDNQIKNLDSQIARVNGDKKTQLEQKRDALIAERDADQRAKQESIEALQDKNRQLAATRDEYVNASNAEVELPDFSQPAPAETAEVSTDNTANAAAPETSEDGLEAVDLGPTPEEIAAEQARHNADAGHDSDGRATSNAERTR